MTADPKTWFSTKVQNLYRHKSGIYYARIIIDGKKTFRSLKTSLLSVAKPELDELFKVAAHQKEISQDTKITERMTGAEAIELCKAQIDNNPSTKRSTQRYWHEIISSFQKTWPEFLTMEMRHISLEACEKWAGKNKGSMSSTRFNNTLSLIKSLFAIAVKKGARRYNPVTEMKRKKVTTKDLSAILPPLEQFREWVGIIRNAGGRFSRACADFVEFLAYTGMRTGEAKWVRWGHCDFKREVIHIVGDPVEATKNGERRYIQMNSAVMELLTKMKKETGARDSTAPVLRVHEAQKAMDRAFKQLGMKRFTHHDLRHYFATICIESGVDILTVAKWLGHKDCGALAMRTYGHVRNEHSRAAAKKVSFAA